MTSLLPLRSFIIGSLAFSSYNTHLQKSLFPFFFIAHHNIVSNHCSIKWFENNSRKSSSEGLHFFFVQRKSSICFIAFTHLFFLMCNSSNGSRLCVVADLDALHCQPTKMLIRCTKLQFCTEPAITQNRCCAFVVLFCPLYSRSILLLLGSHTLCQVLVCVSARATWQCVWLVGWF